MIENNDEQWFTRGKSVWSEYGCICVEVNTPKNAKLIASAPQLLKALQVLVENGGIGPEQMFHDARDAIAKATGEA